MSHSFWNLPHLSAPSPPNTQSRCGKSLTQGCCTGYCRRQWAYHLCRFMALMVSSFLPLSPGLTADVPKLGPAVFGHVEGRVCEVPSEVEGYRQRVLKREKH